MRKASIINGLALALALGVAATASAQSQDRQQRPQRAQSDSGFRRGEGRGGRGPEGMLLKGITLNADQKTRIAAIGERDRKAFGAERAKHEKGQARPQRQRGDTTGFAARRAEMEKRRDQRVAELRTILNGDQRVQFDKNVATMKQRFAQRQGEGKGRGKGQAERGDRS